MINTKSSIRANVILSFHRLLFSKYIAEKTLLYGEAYSTIVYKSNQQTKTIFPSPDALGCSKWCRGMASQKRPPFP